MNIKSFFLNDIYFIVMPLLTLFSEIIIIMGGLGFFNYSIIWQLVSVSILCATVFIGSNYQQFKERCFYFYNVMVFMNSCFLLWVYCKYWKETPEEPLYLFLVVILSVVFGYHISKLFELIKCNKVIMIFITALITFVTFYITIEGLFNMNTDFVSIISGAFLSATLVLATKFK
ncbi:hypothetical protein M8697_003705 [Providencia rettgeri]|nr:hypothetical protein [Providencia rettgeri]ELR5199733.1 hypothetical protein [Providencia rettgeri]